MLQAYESETLRGACTVLYYLGATSFGLGVENTTAGEELMFDDADAATDEQGCFIHVSYLQSNRI